MQYDLIVWQFDVVSAYLNETLDDEIYLKVPSMLDEMLQRILSREGDSSKIGIKCHKMLEDLRSGGNVCKLRKALYGLKQAGRQWYSKLSGKLLNLGLKPTQNEPCLFYIISDGNILLVLIYVDDMIVVSTRLSSITNLNTSLLEDFEIKHLGRAKYCLGLEIIQEANKIKLKQTGFAETVWDGKLQSCYDSFRIERALR